MAENHLTLEQAETLATLVSSLRPDWNTPGIVKALSAIAMSTDPFEATLVLIHAARDTTNVTPAIITKPGPHWDRAKGRKVTTPTPVPATVQEPPKPAPLRPGGVDTSPLCPNHPDLHEWECRTCNVPSPPPPNFRELVEAAAEAARQARLRTHG